MQRVSEILQGVLPASIDSERSVLGAILLDNIAYSEAASCLKPHHFSLESHRRIYARMMELQERGKPVDIITLSEELAKKREVESIGGIAYLASLTDGLPRRPSIAAYVKILQQKELLRALIGLANGITAAAVDQSEDADVVLAQAQEGLIQLAGGFFSERSLREICKDTIDDFTKRLHAKGECVGATTGVAELDFATNGYYESETFVIGARPGNGKTALVCQGIEKNCNYGMKVGFFSCEVPEKQITMRLASRMTGIPVFATRDPRTMKPQDRSEIMNAIGEISQKWEGKLFLDDTPMPDVSRLCAVARGWVARGVELIFVDYLQLLNAPGRNATERVTNAMMALWNLARQTKCKMVILSQLRRHDQDKRPEMEDLRESGAIENFANVIALLWREKQGGELTGRDEIIIPKQRSGPSNITLSLHFDGRNGNWMQRI